jgi:hypothetical protein
VSGLIDRLPILLEEAIEDIPYLKENAANAKKDKNGSSSNTLANLLRFAGVGEYLINSDVPAFKLYLKEAANIKLNLIQRFENGEEISKSYVSMLSYKALFTALASGDFELSESLASVIGGRENIENENDHPFDIALGYALKTLASNADDQAEKIGLFKIVANEADNSDFVGYAEAFAAILNNEVESFLSALQSVVSGHKKQSKGSGIFKGLEDEALSVWGIGLVNLAKFRGLEFQFDDPLIPSSLTS